MGGRHLSLLRSCGTRTKTTRRQHPRSCRRHTGKTRLLPSSLDGSGRCRDPQSPQTPIHGTGMGRPKLGRTQHSRGKTHETHGRRTSHGPPSPPRRATRGESQRLSRSSPRSPAPSQFPRGHHSPDRNHAPLETRFLRLLRATGSVPHPGP
ncbi:MAG: hypothetical protein RLZZ399_2930 [Verrucomicrobiota bacterium]